MNLTDRSSHKRNALVTFRLVGCLTNLIFGRSNIQQAPCKRCFISSIDPSTTIFFDLCVCYGNTVSDINCLLRLACQWENHLVNTWHDEVLHVKKEDSQAALIHHPHSIAFTQKSGVRLVHDIVGHFPLEISHYVWFFIYLRWCVTGIVHNPRYWQSPIPKGGLEIILKVMFTIVDDDKRYLEMLHNLIADNYETPSEKGIQDAQDTMRKSNQLTLPMRTIAKRNST